MTHSRVLGAIHNPAYIGAYVYGCYRDNKAIDAGGHFGHHPIRLPDKEDWKVFLLGHHQAYISWAEFEENQKRLSSDQTNSERCGPARKGAALLTGVLIWEMRPPYDRPLHGDKRHTSFIRMHFPLGDDNKATCSSVPAKALDQAVSEKILAIMKPSELEKAK